ncbi:transaldolase [Salmonella enterica subsp. enterica]|uniref:transaldolase n=1 Tax=unclassified Enterobacter cloacae complex TaxID=2757714 RepID=UPI001287D1E6|nr:transaldolase [Enterobacter cloacae complex sp. 2021EL-01261]EBO9655490.1 transaldolase [Salmonella enterica]EBY0806003.1 transaldolase [Salmonella enterica subsp. enterica serovar Berlin]ECF3780125.1 transaldolase [Salmonella enterica subsp. enterica serovar Oslo]EDR2105425.1 transaldolase [Salmonella enterica subsp. enterica]EDW0612379.1 transaldolase [Salmonella enterica subsp. enterica serovar Ball]EGZ4377629.1 transaldolase [Salmonella enterica subsp. enterica serovar Lexington]
MTILEKLKEVTTVVADSGDITAIREYHPEDATTNPSLILKATAQPLYRPLIEQAIEWANEQGGTAQTRLINASDKLAVNIGLELLRQVPGKVSTEVDARLSFDRGLCVAKARKLIRLYEEAGIERSRVLIKLASTWQGIKAAEELEREGIHCNLTLLFSFAQARACAEAGVWLISPFVGRIYDWYRERQLLGDENPQNDPGVVSVRNIYDYYKKHRYPTVIMGASFRKTAQVIALAGCDRLTIAPALLEELSRMDGELSVALTPPVAAEIQPSPLTEAEFYWLHNQDPMAVDKLAEGIRLFAQDQEKLEVMLSGLLEKQEAANVIA